MLEVFPNGSAVGTDTEVGALEASDVVFGNGGGKGNPPEASWGECSTEVDGFGTWALAVNVGGGGGRNDSAGCAFGASEDTPASRGGGGGNVPCGMSTAAEDD